MRDIFEKQNPWRFQRGFSFNTKTRAILEELVKNLANKKILALLGSRQVGKSSLMYLLIERLIKSEVNVENIFYFNLDNFSLRELFKTSSKLLEFIGSTTDRKYLFIDEVQRLSEPGLFLKEIYDLDLDIKIICSGSSQLEIKSKLKERLGARLRQFEIKRLSFDEYLEFAKPITKEKALEEMLLYGSYPEVSMNSSLEEKKLILRDLYQNYVEKDIVDFLQISNIDSFNKLVGVLASQSGSLLNIDHLASVLSSPRKEIEHYISVLQDTFIIKLIYPFHKLYKKEITKTPKIYFLDLGLRNFAIRNFGEIHLRNDIGELFENFFLLELLAADVYNLQNINFWRTTNQTEIDFVVQSEKGLEAIEIKWRKDSTPKSFETFQKYYPEARLKVLNKDIFLKT